MFLELARVLLERGADMEAWDDEDKRAPLLLGLRDGYADFAHILLRHGAETEAREWASTLRRIRQQVRKTISLQREIN
jgi:hypothetical protein